MEHDEHPRWGREVAAAAYVFYVTMLGTTLPTPLYGLYQRRIHFDPVVQTAVFATYAVGVIAALVLAGQASDRVGRRPVLLVGVGAAAASAVVFALAPDLAGLFTGRLLSGVSAGLFTGTATTALVELAPPARARRAGLVATAANILGLGTGPLVAGLLAAHAPRPLLTPYLLHLALMIVAGVFAATARETVTEPAAQRPPWRALRAEVPEPVRAAFWPAAAANFAGFATFGLFTAVEPRLLSDVLGVHDLVAEGAVVTLVFATSVLVQAVTVAAPAHRLLPLGCATLVVGAAALVVALTAASLTVLLVACVLLGGGQGACFRAGVAEVRAASPAGRQGEVLSQYFVVLYVGISLPVIGVGVLSQLAGLVPAAVVLAGLVAVLALAGGFVGLRRAGAPQAG